MTERLRILHVSDNFLPTLGGLERAVNALAQHWVVRGHQPMVACARHPLAPDREDRADGVLVRRLPLSLQHLPGAYSEPDRVFFPPLADPLFRRAFASLLDEFRPDICHVHGWALYSVIDELTKREVPIVTGAHDAGQVCAKKILVDDRGENCPGPELTRCLGCASRHYGAKGVAISLGLRRASEKHQRVAASLAISSYLAEQGDCVNPRYRRPMQVIPTFVDDGVLEKGARAPRPGWLPNQPYIFFAGALGRHKGVDLLLDAHQMLRREGRDLALVLCGIPRPHERLGFNHPGVFVVEDAAHGEIMGGWRHAACGVVPSRVREGLGQSAIECLAAATPLVVAGHGGLLDVVDNGRYGLLAQPNSAEDLHRQIARILDDHDLAERLRKEGPERARYFTLSSVAPRLEAVYRDVIARVGDGNSGGGRDEDIDDRAIIEKVSEAIDAKVSE